MYLSAFSHRDQLYEITNRWLSDRLAEEDPVSLSRIVTYDSFIAWQALRQLSRTLYGKLTAGPVRLVSIDHKKHLKDFLSQPGMDTTPRMTRLMTAYRRQPEYFYVGSPVTGFIAHDIQGRMLGVARAKRPKRIAEKASRYAALFIAQRIREIARDLASPPPTGLIEASQTVDEALFLKAELHMMTEVRRKGLVLPRESVAIDDILGLKVIDPGGGEAQLEATLSQLADLNIVEKERHQGDYNATHYIVEQRLDLAYIREKFSQYGLRIPPQDRGLPETGIQYDFERFLESGHPKIRIDLIFTTFEELVESEIGRSMHETRIFKQRSEKSGNICVNIEYIIEYLLAVALSPVQKIDQIPIKMWGRYLPDTLGEIIRHLHQMPATLLLKH